MARGLLRSLAAGLALLGAGLAPAGARAAEPWSASDDDALLLDLRAGGYRIGEALRGYQTPDGVCVDLGDLIQALDLPVRLDKKSRRATGWLFAEDQTFTIDRDQLTVQTVNGKAPLRATELHDTPEGWCVALASVSGWFGVRFRADLANATLLLDSDRPLPFLAAIQRQSRAARLRPSTPFDLGLLPSAPLPYRAWRAPSVDAVVKLGLRHEARFGTIRESRYELYAAGELGGASFESRMASDALGHPASLRMRAYRNDPAGRMPLGATQLAAGDVASLAGSLTGQSAVGRGVFVSNRPVARPSRFALTTLRGGLPAGWDAELYRNGQLIGFQQSRSDGRYEFLDVELMFGRNAFEVVLYGPQGQIRREGSEIPVGAANVPAGKTWYWAGVLEQGRDLVELGRDIPDPHTGWRWGVGVERGLDERTVLGAGAQSLMRDGRRTHYLEANLTRALGPMLVELAGAQAFGSATSGRALRGSVLGQVAGIDFQGETLWAFGGFSSELVDPGQRREHSLRLAKTFAIDEVALPVQLGWRRSESRDGLKVTEVLTRLGLHARRLALTAELSQVRTVPRLGPPGPGDDETRLTLLANAGLGKLRLRGDARFRLGGGGFESARLVGETRLSRRSDLRLSGEYRAATGRATLAAGLIRQFDAFSLKAEGDVSNDGTIGASLSLAFSFGPDPVGGGWRLSNEKLAINGQAAVGVWRDEDADGRRDPGEEPVAGVAIAAGLGRSEPTDAAGEARVVGLQPFQPVALAIDQGSLADVFLQPASQGVVVTPRPGIAARVEIALVPTGEAEGSLLDGNGDPRPGVGLELVDARGAVAARTLSEFDGFFLFQQVPYGSYTLRVAAESAQALGIAVAPLGSLRLDRANPVARLGRTSLAPAHRVAAIP